MSTQYAHPAQYGPSGYPGQNAFMQTSGPTFAFKKRFERVDWKKLASADVDAISRNMDFNTLQDNIMNVTFCNLESEIDTRMIDPNFIKLFKLAQLTIEYLLHSQNYLSSVVGTLEGKLKKALDEHDETKKHMDRIQEELVDVKKESHKRKKMLIAQQQIMQAGPNSYNKCAFCSKAFVNGTFLQSHLQRRHPQMSSYNIPLQSQQVPVQEAPPIIPSPVVQPVQSGESTSHLERELDEIRDRLKLTESQLVDERNARNMLGQKDKADDERRDREMQTDMKKWQGEQHHNHKLEVDQIRDMFVRELNELSEKYNASQSMLEDLQRKQVHHSNLGMLQDDVENDRELLAKQRAEVAMMKEQLHEQLQVSLDEKLTQQDKNWKHKLKSMQKEHKKELKELSANVQTTVEELHVERENLENQYQHHLESVQNADDLERERQQEDARKAQEKARKVAEKAKRDQEEAQRLADLETAPKREETPVVTATGVGSAMYDDDSDDETTKTREIQPHVDDDDEANTTEFDGTSTFTTTRGTMSLGQFGTSLSMTEPPSERLLEARRRNPNILGPFRQQALSSLEEELRTRGINANARGLTDNIYNSKSQLLKSERQQLAKKYRNILDIRQSYINLLEQQAKEKLNKQRARQDGSRPGQVALRSSSAPTRPSAPPLMRSNSRDRSKRPSSQPPVPAPRATSPTSRGSLPIGTMSTYRTSVGSSMATTAASSTWDDDDDITNLDMTDGPDMQQRPAATVPARPYKPVKNTRFDDDSEDDETDSESEEEEDSNWDDISDLQGSLEPTPRRRSKAPSTGKLSQSAPQPRGPNVAHISRSIEMQLSGRGRGKKPVGGVDTLPLNDGKPTRQKPGYYEDEDDSLPSVSSYEEDKQHPASRLAPTPQTRSSATDCETNTYGTSIWGNSSRGGVHRAASQNTHTKTSDAADSDDWDSDYLDP